MEQPLTVASLAEELATLGVAPGMTLMVHSSLSSLGYVVGGAPAVILALEAVLGPTGTLVMPTHNGDLSDPANWSQPPVPEAWHQTIRENMPAFQPDLTPAKGMGIIPETFRKQDGTLRSNHPMVSFAARGPEAQFVTAGHRLRMSQGEGSPLARLYDLGAYVLLMGVSYDRNTSFHLAEYRNRFADHKRCKRGAPTRLGDGASQWTTYEDITWHDADFLEIGATFEDTGVVRTGTIGRATCRLFPQKTLVDFAVTWMNANRSLR